MALDLARPLPDPLDPGVAPDSLERQFVHQPHPAVDLDGLVGHHGEHLGRLELGHRHLRVGGRALVVGPAGLEDHQLGRLHLDRHVGELEGDALELADLLAELLTRCSPVERVGEGALGPPQAGGTDLEAGGTEPVVGDLEAPVDLAEHGVLRQAAVVEFENRVAVAAMRDVAVALADGEARGTLVDEEGGDQLPRAAWPLLLARGHEGDGEIGDVGVGDEVLGAAEDPVAAVASGRGLHAAEIGAGARLRHRETIPFLAADTRQEIALALLGRAGQ